ncbi:MAG TPA: HNH endonuclease [Chthoniobacterales bacterium]
MLASRGLGGRQGCTLGSEAVSPLLQSQVLVLNRLWQAVHVCSARRAFLLLYQGVAQVVSTDPRSEFSTFDFTEWLRHSCEHGGADTIGMVSSRLRVPKIIVLRTFDRLPKKDVKFSRQNVFERDRSTCQYCGRQFERDDLNLDHVVPRDRGGQTTWENVVCSCIRCNTKKGNRLPQEAGMGLLRVPRKPRWHPLNAFTLSHQPDASWRKFVDVTFWQVELGDAA